MSPSRSRALPDRLPTGISGLDTLMHGGIPTGRSTLLVGRSGTYKTLLCLQLVCNLARRGVRAVFLTAEQEVEDLVKVARALNFGVDELLEAGALTLVDLTRAVEQPVMVSGVYDVNGLIYRIRHLVQERRAQVVVLDSVTALFAPLPHDAPVRTEFSALVRALRQQGVTALLTAEGESDYTPLTRLGVEDYVCDLVIVLRNVIDGKRRRRSVEIHKYRTSSHYKGEYPVMLGEQGLAVFPMDTEEEQPGAKTERYSTGLAGLDEMTGGGWLRDSIMLVRGPAGSGKTTLAGMFARAGAQRGERVFYYGFEETEPILLRNFQSIGLPLERYVKRGTLKLVCRYPEATSPEDMVVELRDVLDKYQPSLIVLDSISSVEHVSSFEGFRQFIIGLSSSLRRHGRSALLLQSVSEAKTAEGGAPYLSTLADAILVLGYRTAPEQALQRYLRILKMRGTAHDTREHVLGIGKGGLEVGMAKTGLP